MSPSHHHPLEYKKRETKTRLKDDGSHFRNKKKKKKKLELFKRLFQCTDRESCLIRKSLWPEWFSSTIPLLRKTSKKIISRIKIPHKCKFVNIGKVVTGSEDDNRIFTIIFNEEMEDRVPMVIVHGFGSLAFDFVEIAKTINENETSKRPFYLFDTIGFNQSSRPDFFKYPTPDDGSRNGSGNGSGEGNNSLIIPPAFSEFAPPDFLRKKNLVNRAFKAEMEFIKCIEAWRRALNLKKFILVGHSFGGYLAASYAINYPENISHLVLADPWGFVEHKPFITLFRNIIKLPFNPFFYVRLAGPRIANKISDVISRHIYYCNVQNPSGEEAFAIMVLGFQYARNPMINRMHLLPKDIPLTFIYGNRTWIDTTPAINLRNSRDNTIIRMVPNAGHVVFNDNPEVFNSLLRDAALVADRNEGKL
nr:MAG: hypothetical protein [Porcellio scaber clopovirus]